MIWITNVTPTEIGLNKYILPVETGVIKIEKLE
jgi:hypothetical protein